jgi:hypothetical protein
MFNTQRKNLDMMLSSNASYRFSNIGSFMVDVI